MAQDSGGPLDPHQEADPGWAGREGLGRRPAGHVPDHSCGVGSLEVICHMVPGLQDTTRELAKSIPLPPGKGGSFQ